ncbi:hypothetical protein IP510_07850 [Psychrobacter sp. NG254]|uniref:hypothetical protein n=1 Tax=unclassified Psychrobacter TaxID=196806 RepID=UPI001886DEA7|nr:MULTISPECIES: hypothetical protein [unclassified Psychrobacter]MBF2719791.1 hypothetical protein [Psychrobacter sp. NG254]MBH0007508.1 hypothetical protein [Psychrobacter sp. SWN149]
MKFIKLTAISAAVLASTAALAAEPVIVVDNNDAVVYEAEPVAVAYQAEPVAVAYEAEETNTGIIGKTTGAVRNTTGAIFGGTKTLFQTAINPASVSAEAGTLGYGANIGWSINDKTELQAGWAGGDVADLFGGDFDANDINYDVDSDFSNPYLGVQVRPMANWFTVGAGIIVPDNDIDVRANSEGPNFRINDVDYNASETGTLSGTIEHRNKLAPYGTIGFRPNITNNFGVFGEIGAAYMGKTDATVTSSNPDGVVTAVSGNSDNTSTTVVTGKDVAKAAEQELEDKDYLEWFPIVKVGATYRF